MHPRHLSATFAYLFSRCRRVHQGPAIQSGWLVARATNALHDVLLKHISTVAESEPQAINAAPAACEKKDTSEDESNVEGHTTTVADDTVRTASTARSKIGPDGQTYIIVESPFLQLFNFPLNITCSFPSPAVVPLRVKCTLSSISLPSSLDNIEDISKDVKEDESSDAVFGIDIVDSENDNIVFAKGTVKAKRKLR